MRGIFRRILARRPTAGARAPDEASAGFEVTIAVLLGIAAIATAFAAYKASLDDGDSIQQYNQGVALTDKASQAYNEGTQELVQDQSLFLEYVKAVQTDDEELAAYMQTTLMSDNLRAAVEWWADQPGDEFQTPFVDENPEYVIESYGVADELDQEAEAAFAKGQRLDKRGDRYTLVTVILAAALFLLGIASVTRALAVKLGFMLVGTVFLIGSLVQTGRILWG